MLGRVRECLLEKGSDPSSSREELWSLDEDGEYTELDLEFQNNILLLGAELYARGRTAVLSSGGLTSKCFTVPSPIVQTLRVTFYTYPDRPRFLSTTISPEPVGDPVVSTCILDGERKVLRVFTDKVRLEKVEWER